MTPPRFDLNATLVRLDWTNAALARKLGCDERNVRRWLDGDAAVPFAIKEWLTAVVAALDAAPPPPTKWRVRAQPAQQE